MVKAMLYKHDQEMMASIKADVVYLSKNIDKAITRMKEYMTLFNRAKFGLEKIEITFLQKLEELFKVFARIEKYPKKWQWGGEYIKPEMKAIRKAEDEIISLLKSVQEISNIIATWNAEKKAAFREQLSKNSSAAKEIMAALNNFMHVDMAAAGRFPLVQVDNLNLQFEEFLRKAKDVDGYIKSFRYNAKAKRNVRDRNLPGKIATKLEKEIREDEGRFQAWRKSA